MLVPALDTVEISGKVGLGEADGCGKGAVERIAINELEFELLDGCAEIVAQGTRLAVVFFCALEIEACGGDVVGLGVKGRHVGLAFCSGSLRHDLQGRG